MAINKLAEENKKLVMESLRGVFIERNKDIPARNFSTHYVQHNPAIPNGSSAIPALIESLSDAFTYEPGMVVAEGEFVMVHGRYTGWGPKPMVAVDIFRVVDGKLVEHWDVMQEEVPVSKTVSGNPMFTNRQG